MNVTSDTQTETEMPCASICQSLQSLRREKVSHLKSRIKLDNRLCMSVANSLGYYPGLDEGKRKDAMNAAKDAMERLANDETCPPDIERLRPLVESSRQGIDGFGRHVKLIESAMKKLAKQLPIIGWLEQPEQRGFGIQQLADLIGETGDLANYDNPGKMWRRMGCAPYEANGESHMGESWRVPKWRTNGGLTAEQWEDFGYCPRRRSLAYLVGEGLVKQNKSIYRARYDSVKAAKLALEDKHWPKIRCHKHAMLLASKLLMRELWCAWNPGMVVEQNW